MTGLRRLVELPGPIDLVRTMRRFALHTFEPSMRVRDSVVWCAFRTPDGPAAIRYEGRSPTSVAAEAFGPGAASAIESAPDHLGAHDRPEEFAPSDDVVAPIHRRFPGLRYGRTGRVFERLVPTILGQKVTGAGAARSYKELVFRYGEPAPEPAPKLWLMPTPERMREMAYYDFHPLGVERKRAETILGVVRRAVRLERLVAAGSETTRARLCALPGIGPWTSEIVIAGALGDADAVPTGDYNLPNMVVHAFTGAPRGDDAQMLELLEPFRPHRGRVVWLLGLGAPPPPRWGARLSVRDIRRQ